MSLNVPGKGGGVIPVVAGGTTGVAALTTLPATGANAVNDVAIALVAAMAVWAVLYLKLRRSNQV